MHDPAMHNNPILGNLVIYRIEKYQNFQPIISHFLKLEALRRSCQELGLKEDRSYTQKSKRAHHNKSQRRFS